MSEGRSMNIPVDKPLQRMRIQNNALFSPLATQYFLQSLLCSGTSGYGPNLRVDGRTGIPVVLLKDSSGSGLIDLRNAGEVGNGTLLCR